MVQREFLSCAGCRTLEEDLPPSRATLRKCGGCTWICYCSTTCQTLDYPRHKAECKIVKAGLRAGKDLSEALLALLPASASKPLLNDPSDSLLPLPLHRGRYDLVRIWPLLAVSVAAARMKHLWPRPRCMLHAVARHEVLFDLSQRITFKSAVLGPKEFYSDKWKAGGMNAENSVLWRRLNTAGWTLEKALGVLVALKKTLGELKRTLTYQGEDILDYGVASGHFNTLVSEDRLVCRYADGTLEPIQPDDDHYWIYFQSRSFSIIVDACVHPWNLRLAVAAEPYTPPMLRQLLPDVVPGFFMPSDVAAMHGYMRKPSHVERPGPSRYSVATSATIDASLSELDSTHFTDNLTEVALENGASKFPGIMRQIRREGRQQDGRSDLDSVQATLLVAEDARVFLREGLKGYESLPKQVYIATMDEPTEASFVF